MRTVIAILLWFILFSISWPLALILLFLFPLVWLILLPFRLVGFTLEFVLRVIRAILEFPFRVDRRI